MNDYVELNALGVKLAIVNAESNLESAKVQVKWGIEGAAEREAFWTKRLAELKQLK